MGDHRKVSTLRQQLLIKQQNIKKLRARLVEQEAIIKEKEQYDLELSKLVPTPMIENLTTGRLEAMVRNTEKFTGLSFYDHEMSNSKMKWSGTVLATDKEFVITTHRSPENSGTRLKLLNVRVKDDDEANNDLKMCCRSNSVFMVMNFLKEIDKSESDEN